MAPPPLSAPEKTLKRVLTISKLNGWSVIAVAGLGILLALVLGDWSSVIIGLLVVGSGVMEIRGHHKLKRRDAAGGMQLLVRSQMFLLAVILVYCASRLGSYDSDSMLANVTPEMKAMLKDSGIEMADLVPLVHLAFLLIYGVLALTCLIYQGGLAVYYRRKTALVTQALAAPPVVAPDSPLAYP
jgi:hypothetical protein